MRKRASARVQRRVARDAERATSPSAAQAPPHGHPQAFAHQPGNPVTTLLSAQRIFGNQAVQRMIHRIQREGEDEQPTTRTRSTTLLERPKDLPPVPSKVGRPLLSGGTPPPTPSTEGRPSLSSGGPPKKAPPLTPPQQQEMDNLGKSPEVWASEAVNEAIALTTQGLIDFNSMVTTRLAAKADTASTTAADGAKEMLKQHVLTDALSLLHQQVTAVQKPTRGGGTTPQQSITGKYKFDKARFAGTASLIVPALNRAKAAPVGTSQPKLDEFKQLSAEAMANKFAGDPKKLAKAAKKIAKIVAVKASETALSSSPVINSHVGGYVPQFKTAGRAAAQDIIDQQVSFSQTSVARDGETALLLAEALKSSSTNRRDLIANAGRIKARTLDYATTERVDAIEVMAEEAAATAANAKVEEVKVKAGEALLMDLTKNQAKLKTLRTAASLEVDRILKDPTLSAQVADEAISEKLEGSVNSKLKFISSVIGGGKKPGDTKTIDLTIRVPVDPNGIGYVGFQVRSVGRRTQDLGLDLHAELSIVGGAKIPGVDVDVMGKLGGYFDIKVGHTGDLKEDGVKAANLLSYAMYRRFRESRIIPDAVTNTMWGMGGKTMKTGETKSAAKMRESEAWGAAIEEGVGEHDSVETGALLGASAKAKVAGVGIKGGATMYTGTRYTKKSIEEARARGGGVKRSLGRGQKSVGRGVTSIGAEFSTSIGPLNAGANFKMSMLDWKRDEDPDKILDARLEIFARGMVMKKAMFGDPAEAAVRIITWIAEMAKFADSVMERADEQSKNLKDNGRDLKGGLLARKGMKLVKQPINAGGAILAGEWEQQHALFEQQQAVMEGASSINEVGGMVSDTASSVPGAVSESVNSVGSGLSGIPGAISSGNLSGINPLGGVSTALAPVTTGLKEIKEAVLDKTAGLQLKLALDWPGGGRPMTGDISLDYVKRTGALILNAMKTTGFIDASFEKTNQLVNLRFTPDLKVNWLFDDVDKQKLINTKNYLKRQVGVR